MIGSLLFAATLHLASLYCDGKAYKFDAWPEYAVKKAILRDRTFTMWIVFGWQGPKKEAMSLTKSDPFGIQLDNAVVTSIHPLTRQTKSTMALSFPNLGAGPH